ncbi:MAG: alpha/beta hydrolase-fold protein [Bacteroidota bacterium]
MAIMNLQAQYTVKLVITALPEKPATDTIYIAGNFNSWNPQDETFLLQKDKNGHFFLEIKDVAPDSYEFKFTRGSWNKSETDKKGADLHNRTVTIRSDTTLHCNIAGWKDGLAQEKQASSASAQVSIIDTAFALPQLGRTRRIWIYLPKGYNPVAAKKYPVLYMHDGQNLFDEATSFSGEWGIDETMDSTSNACIVVGIDHGGPRRMNEYNPNDTKQFGKGEGRAYLAFIVDNLKPFIDKNYRTLPDKLHTCMAGSSMGGLISFYAGLYYPRIFGALGVFSPSFWIAPEISNQLKQLARKSTHGSQCYYFYAGGDEGAALAPEMESVAGELKHAADPRILTIVNPGGKHNEPAWSAVFPAFYKWVFSE